MENGTQFEQEVRRIARFRWPAAEFAGAEMYAGRERDGIFITEDCVHVVECTISREKAKALKDLEKLYQISKDYRTAHTDKAVKCWFVTLHEPTADQRACRKEIKGAHEALFNIVSFAQFQAKLIDAFEYLQDRERHKFGSIYDPRSGNPNSEVKYVHVGLTCSGESVPVSAEFVANALLSGEKFAILGEYGIGKSMTLREVFRELAKAHRRGVTPKIPLYINLREHQGQQEPAEILIRHGRNIGFPNPSQLVRAWKAGYAILLLDGFDEVSSMGLQGAWRRLRDARQAAMAGVRRLALESPQGAGFAIAGRENFFDTADERRHALGQSSAWKEIRLDEFTEGQIRDLVKEYGFTGEIPSWVPSRPLLLATLFAKGLTPEVSRTLSALDDASAGWNLLLEEVCSREARIEHGITGQNVRGILESLATVARSKDSGVGPLTPDEIVAIFQEECGFVPNDEALIVLQRLPGLGRDPVGDETSRAFVDSDFADACRAGDFVQFCTAPFTFDKDARLLAARITMRSVGIGLAAMRLSEKKFSEGNLTAALKVIEKLGSNGATPADLVALAMKLDIPIRMPIRISKLFIDHLEVDGSKLDLSNVTLEECYFDTVEISVETSSDNAPRLTRCLIQELEGRISEADLPEGCFEDCVIEAFVSNAGTTSSVLDLAIPVGARVMITVLKKLFVRSLSGRKENGLYRGLDADHQAKVSPVLNLLQAHGLITTSGRSGDPIWLPVRRQRTRVLSILNSPSKGDDPVLVAARKI